MNILTPPRYCPPFIPMATVLKPAASGLWRVERFVMSVKDVKAQQAMATWSHNWGEVRDAEPGTYMRLVGPDNFRDGVVMSDVPMERRENREVVERAHGRVLIAGLGLGMILLPILLNPHVKYVTVVEKESDVCRMVEPQLMRWAKKHTDGRVKCQNKFHVVLANVHTYAKESTASWDVVYFDIWDSTDGRNYDETKVLWREFRGKFNRYPNGWMGAWRRADMKEKALA